MKFSQRAMDAIKGLSVGKQAMLGIVALALGYLMVTTTAEVLIDSYQRVQLRRQAEVESKAAGKAENESRTHEQEANEASEAGSEIDGRDRALDTEIESYKQRTRAGRERLEGSRKKLNEVRKAKANVDVGDDGLDRRKRELRAIFSRIYPEITGEH